MKQINRYRLCGTVMVDVYIDIDAPTLEDAIEYAENNVAIEEYANGTIGVEDAWNNFVTEIESQEFTSPLDVVLYFEG